MSKKRHKHKRKQLQRQVSYVHVLSLVLFCCLLVLSILINHQVQAYREAAASSPVIVAYDANIGIRPYVEEFFTNNDAAEMIPIIECESQFRHFDDNGDVLKNHAGSSATGITQILASKHPDPKVLTRYNRRHNTDLTVDDFDITTLMGNIGYALVLYEVRGTRDWECAKKV